GETLAGVAAASGVGLARLLSVNGWTGATATPRGTLVRIPMPATRADVAGSAETAPAAASVPPPEPATVGAAKAPPRAPVEPVSERQTANRDALLPAASPSGNSDTTD